MSMLDDRLFYPVRGYGLMIAIGILRLTEFWNIGQGNKKFPQSIFSMQFSGAFWGGGIASSFVLDHGVAGDCGKSCVYPSDADRRLGGVRRSDRGVLAGYLYCRVKKLPFLNYFDLLVPSVALAQGFGRIGCF